MVFLARNSQRRWAILALLAAAFALFNPAFAADFVVYGVYRPLDMGNPGETPEKDYYVNMGTANGLHAGAMLDVYRKVSTYDLVSEKLYRDITYKIGTLKVIHAEGNAAVARLDKFASTAQAPAFDKYVMAGDIVRPAGSE